MSRDEKFASLIQVLDAFVQSTDAMKAASSASLEGNLRPCEWRSSDIEEKVTALKTHSAALSGSCTKLSLVDLASMPDDGLQSLFDEILGMSQGVINAVMVLYGEALSRPLFEDTHKLVKAELLQVHGLVTAIHTGKFETCKAAIGQVWEMNEAIQKLPLSNKVAYKRALMGVLSVVKDTHREFKEAREENVIKTGENDDGDNEKCENNGSNMDDDWDILIEDGMEESFTQKELVYVDACLSMMEKIFTVTKVIMDIMSLVSERTVASSVFACDSPLHDVKIWVATVYAAASRLSTVVTDLGMELYAPLSTQSLQIQYNIAYDSFTEIHSKISEAFESCTVEACILDDEATVKIKKLASGTKDILALIDVEKQCFE